MKDVEGERRLSYGLRNRKTGEMLRVEPVTELVYDDSDTAYPETQYRLTTDTQHPIYDAGSPEVLALVFSNRYGSEPHAPTTGNVRPDEVEPVVIEEVVTRRVSPTGLPFDVPIRVETLNAFDLNARSFAVAEGLREALGIIDGFKEALRTGKAPGSEYPWGDYHVMGLILDGSPDSLPEGLPGSIVSGRSGAGSRRALIAFPIPEKMLHLTERQAGKSDEATVLVCLSDTRSVPAGLMEALAEMSPRNLPAPR